MTIQSERVDSIMFDSFTTLVDVRSSTRRALKTYVEEPRSIGELWRFRAVDYRMVSTFTGEYRTYIETTRDALEYALAVHDEELPASVLENLTGVFFDLDVYNDVRPELQKLAEAGYDLYVLSNGNPEVLNAMLESASIEELIEDMISADEIEIYKPDPRLYDHAIDRVGGSKTSVAHVATPWYDVYGAKHAGIQTVWVNRDDRPWDRFDGEPDLTVDSLAGVTDAFVSASH